MDFFVERKGWLLLCVILISSCSGGNDEPSEPDSVPSLNIVNQPLLSLAKNKLIQPKQITKADFSNSTGQIILRSEQEVYKKNFTIEIKAKDPEGIEQVFLAVTNSNKVIVVCEPCESEITEVITGVNPRDLDIDPGSFRFELWIKDLSGNQRLVSDKTVQWQPDKVIVEKIERKSGQIAVNWSASQVIRSNIYLMNERTDQIGAAIKRFLSIDAKQFIIPDAEPDKLLYMIVSGVDDSGESQFSDLIRIKPEAFFDNQDPVAANDFFTLDEDLLISGNVLENDTDPESDSLRVTLTASPQFGELTLKDNGDFTYQPNTHFNGKDVFSYRLNDDAFGEAYGIVELSVLPVNDPPQSLPESYSTDEDTLLEVSAPGVLANDMDVDGDNLTVELLVGAEFGDVTLLEDGSFSYQPFMNYDGTDQFVYLLSDPSGDSVEQSVSILINPINDPPQAVNDEYSLVAGQLLSVSDSNGVLSNDSDPDGDSLTVSALLSEPENGTLLLNENGGFTYDVPIRFQGTDSFSYQIQDGSGEKAQASVVLNIAAAQLINATDDAYNVIPALPLIILAFNGVLSNDESLLGAGLSASVVQQPSHGLLLFFADGGFIYTPAFGFFGQDSFTYQVRDSDGNVANATVRLNVNF